MEEAIVSTSGTPRKRRRWLRRFLWFAVLLVLLVVGGYFVATSSAFLKIVVLPRVGSAIGAEVTVGDIAVHPFKEVSLSDLKVQTKGQEPLLKAGEVRARYDLMDILRGNIHVDEITISSPAITLAENPDGTSNLDPILKALAPKPREAEAPAHKPSKPSKPPQVDLAKLSLSDATIQRTKLHSSGSRDVAELSHVNISLDSLRNGQSGKLTIGANIKLDNNPPPPGTNGVLEAKLDGSFTFALTADLSPGSIQGSTRLEVSRAEGAFAQAGGLGASLECELSPGEIKQVALQFQKGNARLGQLRASGPFDVAKQEGRLNVEILSIDKQVLKLAGAASGIDFGDATLNCTNEIELAAGGSNLSASGQVALDKLQLTRAHQTTPQLDIHAAYDVAIDRAGQNAVLRRFTLSGTQQGKRLINADLTTPMTLAWGAAANAVGDSSITLAVTNLDLADWKPFLGENPPSGQVALILALLSKKAGKQLTFDLDSSVANLDAGSGSNRITQAAVRLQAKGQLDDFKKCSLSDFKLDLARQSQQLASVSGSGIYDLAGQAAGFDLGAKLMLPQLLQAVPQPDVEVTSGTVELKAHLGSAQQTNNLKGTLTLQNFSGRVAKNEFHTLGAVMDLDLGASPSEIEIRKGSTSVDSKGNLGGSLDLTGTYNPGTKSGQVTIRLVDFNQNGLAPFLEPLLADKKLVSVDINGSASAQFSPQGDSAMKADLQIGHLVVSDPKRQFPSTPLEVKLLLDASVQNRVARLQQLQLTLTPTTRARNQVELTGQVDMSNTNAIQGNIKLEADSLDVTPYYDLFAGGNKTAAKGPASGKAQLEAEAISGGPEREPDAMQLPVRNSVCEVNVGRFYLREVEVTNLQAVLKLDGSRVTLNPCRLALNGAAVSAGADVDLSVPGYKYNCNLNAQPIPLAPLVNSFAPNRKGEIAGTLVAQAQLSGAGITGASLQKNLSGQFDVSSTNLNLSVDNARSPSLRLLITVVAFVPELYHNPEAGVVSFFQGVTGLGKGGLADDLNRSPISAIVARGSIGGGQVDLQTASVQSPAFRAEATGEITLAHVLTNSALRIPISLSLSRSIADRLGFTPSGAPATLSYVKMPDFYTEVGTIGDPKPDIKKAALLGAALKGVVGAIPVVGGTASSVLKGVEGVLTGRPADGSNTAGTANTNQPATNKAPLDNLLNRFLNPGGK